MKTWKWKFDVISIREKLLTMLITFINENYKKKWGNCEVLVRFSRVEWMDFHFMCSVLKVDQTNREGGNERISAILRCVYNINKIYKWQKSSRQEECWRAKPHSRLVKRVPKRRCLMVAGGVVKIIYNKKIPSVEFEILISFLVSIASLMSDVARICSFCFLSFTKKYKSIIFPLSDVDTFSSKYQKKSHHRIPCFLF